MGRERLTGWLIATTPMVAVLTWWLIGDVSEPDLFSPDYMIEPPQISPSTETVIGSAAAVLATAILIVLLHARRRGAITKRQLAAVTPLAALGAFAGFTFRVFTAGVSGANIGAGLLMMGSVVIVPALLTVAHLLWRPRTEADR